MCVEAASSSPPPTTAPCIAAMTGVRPNWIASNARCHMRECITRSSGLKLLGHLGEIEAGGEMLTFAGQHDRADVLG